VKEMEYQQDEGVFNEKLAGQVNKIIENCHSAMNDDFNTALTIGQLFNLLKKINSLHTLNLKFGELGQELFAKMKSTFIEFIEDVLGLQAENPSAYDDMVEALVTIYREAKFKKDFAQVDKIRAALKENGIIVKDMKSGIEWAYEE
jgi:cysteinyl-tRNA synthetase